VWSELFELAVVLLAAWLVWRVIAGRLNLPRRRRQSAEPGDYAGSAVRLRPRPKAGAGAVALAEPDEEEEDEAC